MSEKPTPSTIRAALMRGGKAKILSAMDAGAKGQKSAPNRSAMWAKALRRPSDTASARPATPLADPTPIVVAQQGAPINRAAIWERAMKEAARNPLPDFDPD